jgi:DNA-binding beta-propeller fold protein YncE
MRITSDSTLAVVADPDRDRVMVVDLATGETRHDIALQANDEPGRVIEDPTGKMHIALRRGGGVVTLDPRTGEITARRATCAEPRGLAYDAAIDSIYVACRGGELVTLPAGGGDPTRTIRLDRDLRDVVVTADGKLVVTRFRTAEVLRLDAAGAIISRTKSPVTRRADFSFSSDTGTVDAKPAIAWRTIPLRDGSVLMLHQRQVDKELGTTETGGYGGGCSGEGGPVEAAVTVIGPTGFALATAPVFFGALPVDVAPDRDGNRFAFVTAGNQNIRQVRSTIIAREDNEECPQDTGGNDVAPMINDQLGTPTSVDYTADGTLVVFYPEVPALVAHARDNTARTFLLPGQFGYDSGREMFHMQTPVGIACASCHPEGHDDGLTWKFAFGSRRTQNVSGGILARAPYHWVGDMTNLTTLMNDVFAVRMAAGPTTHSQQVSLGPWLDRIPAPAPVAALDQVAADRGRVLFESQELACVSCHNGPQLTNNTKVNVGTGGTFKVPSLIGIGARAPFLHDGCAATLTDRFATCGTTAGVGSVDLHGRTSQLDAAQIADLVAYLETL